ncbi:hypothetical protein D3C85_1040270 [compost metagenome]
MRGPLADRFAGGQVDGGDVIAGHAGDVEAMGRGIEGGAGQTADRGGDGPLDLVGRAVDDPDQVRTRGVARVAADDGDIGLVALFIDDDLAHVSAVVFLLLTDDSDDGAGLQINGRDSAGAGVGAIEDLGAAVQAQAVERTF